MINICVKVQPSVEAGLKKVASKLGITLSQLLRDCMFLSLIHLDTSTPGVVRFKVNKVEA